jgi:hypothetical protein
MVAKSRTWPVTASSSGQPARISLRLRASSADRLPGFVMIHRTTLRGRGAILGAAGTTVVALKGRR